MVLGLWTRLGTTEEIIFAVREPKGPHWYENFGYQAPDPAKVSYGALGQLCRFDLATGKLQVLLEDLKGAVRDPCVDYDGSRILFSYRKGGSPYFHLYTILNDGSDLRQLTDGPGDDIEPVWLPDGGIAFCSSRCNRFVPCWYVPVAILHRCDGDGRNIRPLSSNIEQDNTPWVLPDGRIMYTRWEYVDRSREHFHHLWTMNPDGSGQSAYYGNMHPGGVFLDAKPVPGKEAIVMIHSPNHGRAEHEGSVAVVRTDLGPDSADAQRIIPDGQRYRDPFPLGPDSFLVAEQHRVSLLDSTGRARRLYSLPPELIGAGAWVHEPRPLRARPREPVIPARSDFKQSVGEILVTDVYSGRNMEGVARGSIKKLLILENLPKPINFSGSMDPISYGGSYTLNRVLGTVPVNPDGSVHARVPPLRSLQLVALDANHLSVKRMNSFLTVMPGEVAACGGCHAQGAASPRSDSPANSPVTAPAEIAPIPGIPEVFDYPRDIQPIWDKHCLPCHDTEHYAGRALLTGDQGPIFTHSYWTLSARVQIADGRDLARGNYPPYRIGSSASPLMEKLGASHHGVNLSEQELLKIKVWIDASATFPGTYAALGSGMIGSYAALQYGTKPNVNYLGWPSLKAAKEVIDRRCAGCHSASLKLPASPDDDLGFKLHHLAYGRGAPRFWEPPWIRNESSSRPGSLEWMKKFADPRLQFSRHILYNLSTPEKSLQLLAPLAQRAGGLGLCGEIFKSREDPDYRKLLAGIQATKRHLDAITRFSMPNFRPEPEYIREMQHYGILSRSFEAGDPIDVYATDRRYWESLWHKP